MTVYIVFDNNDPEEPVKAVCDSMALAAYWKDRLMGGKSSVVVFAEIVQTEASYYAALGVDVRGACGPMSGLMIPAETTLTLGNGKKLVFSGFSEAEMDQIGRVAMAIGGSPTPTETRGLAMGNVAVMVVMANLTPSARESLFAVLLGIMPGLSRGQMDRHGRSTPERRELHG